VAKVETPAVRVPDEADPELVDALEDLLAVCTEQAKAINDMHQTISTLRAKLRRLEG